MEWTTYTEIIGIAMPYSIDHNIVAWNGRVKSAISPLNLFFDYLDKSLSLFKSHRTTLGLNMGMYVYRAASY